MLSPGDERGPEAGVRMASARVGSTSAAGRGSLITLDHAGLCALAARWLRRSRQQGGPGCQIAFTEIRIGFLAGESPDAIGFRISGSADAGSTVVECKTSRGDFLADARKPHRQPGSGMGRWRYFLCPLGLIAVDEVPAGWGLLHAGGKSAASVVPVLGPATRAQVWGQKPSYEEWLGTYANSHDADRETLLLANLLHRIGDAGGLNARLRKADGLSSHYARGNDRLRQQLREAEHRTWLASGAPVGAYERVVPPPVGTGGHKYG